MEGRGLSQARVEEQQDQGRRITHRARVGPLGQTPTARRLVSGFVGGDADKTIREMSAGAPLETTIRWKPVAKKSDETEDECPF